MESSVSATEMWACRTANSLYAAITTATITAVSPTAAFPEQRRSSMFSQNVQNVQKPGEDVYSRGVRGPERLQVLLINMHKSWSQAQSCCSFTACSIMNKDSDRGTLALDHRAELSFASSGLCRTCHHFSKSVFYVVCVYFSLLSPKKVKLKWNIWEVIKNV